MSGQVSGQVSGQAPASTPAALRVTVLTDTVDGLMRALPPPAGWLSPAELVRFAALSAGPRRAQFVAGRWLARQALARAMGGGWGDWTLSAGGEGPPLASGPYPAWISLSHSADRVACAVAAAPVGLDLEAIRPRRGLAALAEATSSAAERAALPDLVRAEADEPARLLAFLHAWTLKEAWLKRNGGNLFAAMLGREATLRAVSAAQADACTWVAHGAVFALSSGGPAQVDGAAARTLRHWCQQPPAGAQDGGGN